MKNQPEAPNPNPHGCSCRRPRGCWSCEGSGTDMAALKYVARVWTRWAAKVDREIEERSAQTTWRVVYTPAEPYIQRRL